MIARRSVWRDEKVLAALAKFVPAADEVWHLQHDEGPEGKLFHRVSEQGHYAGRTFPTDTRQGIYATTARGKLLASINSNDPARVQGMLEEALLRFEEVPEEERKADDAPVARAVDRWERLYPEDGLVLRVTVRDVGREWKDDDRWATAWNRDYAWFRKEEARSFFPAEPKPGDRHEVPQALVARVARLHLVDIVRGQSNAYEAKHVVEARLESEVVSVDSAVVRLRLSGRTKTLQEGSWQVKGLDQGAATPQERGFDATLLGRATWDLAKERFTAFELLAVGLRRGATRYNGRADDPGPAPMGVALVLASGEPRDRVAPASVWIYGWR